MTLKKMKKRYIFGIVATALLAVAVIAFYVYKNWGDIQDAFSGKKSVRGGAVKAAFSSKAPATPVSPDAIVNAAKPSSKLVSELSAIKSKTKEFTDKANMTFTKVINTFKTEKATKASQSVPISQIVVENTKQRKAKDETAAADEYNNILKQIEIEKAKAAISLTGARTENQKTVKYNTLNVDALDAEMELYSENKIRTRGSRRPLTKGEAEAYVRNFMR
jgi:hypothetical protein